MLHSFNQPFGELPINALVNRHPAGRRAALPASSKSSPHCAIHRQIQIGIVHHDDDVLAAHLQRYVLEIRLPSMSVPSDTKKAAYPPPVSKPRYFPTPVPASFSRQESPWENSTA